MILCVKVKPNQRFDRVEKIGNGTSKSEANWQIRLKAPAVDGKANQHLVEYLSEVLDVSKSKIVIKKGATSKVKWLEIELSELEVNSKLGKVMMNK